ncbi:MAG: putative sulfonate transporter, ATP-binding protein [Firmicutes bacterium]|nr:putative sulfonate transporter, ATP-binding protein [Bacillota bacterium]
MVMVTHDSDDAIFLATKIVVMSYRPAKIKKILPNNIPYPRMRDLQEFSNLRNEIISLFELPRKSFDFLVTVKGIGRLMNVEISIL